MLERGLRRLGLVLAIIVASPQLALAATPAPSTSLTPILWSGRVVDQQGSAVPARVSAFLRPPATAIPEQGQGTPPPSIPLATTGTGRDGGFELRAEAPAVPALYRRDGWWHVMVLAEAADGSWSIATDSVRWVPSGSGLPRGAWFSTLAGVERADRLRATKTGKVAALERLVSDDLSSGHERPQVMQLGAPRTPGTGPQPVGWQGPGEPFRGCTARYVEAREKALRTISDIDVGPRWSYKIDYTSTGTTSWDVGYEQSGGKWKVAGTTSFSDNRDTGFNAVYGPYRSRFREAYQVRLVHAKVLWQCASQISPGPFFVRTVEPESWTGGTYNQGDPVVGCKSSETEPVAGNTFSWRGEGKASKYSASGAVFGFSGRASVTYSKKIKLGWMNHLGHPRRVCGESDHPFHGRTRVVALDT